MVHLANRLGQLQGARIALLGLAFKPGTDDLREASSLVLAPGWRPRATLVVHDPVVGDEVLRSLPAGTVKVAQAADALAGADAAIVVTEWPEYLDLVRPALASSMARPLLVDGRNLIDPSAAASAGFEWVGVGRPDCLPDALATGPRLDLDLDDAAAPAPVAGG
ncbi:MAG: UDP binding domain-containing protein [Acidimicrobiales bacterium]